MLENCKNARERWGGVHKLIDQWLHHRQELIVVYCRLSDESRKKVADANRAAQLRQFCQQLMDYVSAGHFEIYDQLAREAEAFHDGGEKLLEELMPRLNETTGAALDFNDYYDTDENCQEAWDSLPEQLSQMGESLATRFRLEDRLIERLHNAHQARVTAS